MASRLAESAQPSNVFKTPVAEELKAGQEHWREATVPHTPEEAAKAAGEWIVAASSAIAQVQLSKAGRIRRLLWYQVKHQYMCTPLPTNPPQATFLPTPRACCAAGAR